MEKLLDAYFAAATGDGLTRVVYVVEEDNSIKELSYPPCDKDASVLLNKVLKTKDAILKNKADPNIERIPGIEYKFTRKCETEDFLISECFVFEPPEPVEFKIYMENRPSGKSLYAQFEVEPGNGYYSVERISIDSGVVHLVGNLSAKTFDENVEKYILWKPKQSRFGILKRPHIF